MVKITGDYVRRASKYCTWPIGGAKFVEAITVNIQDWEGVRYIGFQRWERRAIRSECWLLFSPIYLSTFKPFLAILWLSNSCSCQLTKLEVAMKWKSVCAPVFFFPFKALRVEYNCNLGFALFDLAYITTIQHLRNVDVRSIFGKVGRQNVEPDSLAS